MRITCVATGSRGDVQPYIALAVGLKKAGHEVMVATHDEFQGLVTEYELGFYSLGGDPRAMLETEMGRGMLESGKNPLSFVRSFSKLVEPICDTLVKRCHEALKLADAMVAPSTGILEKGLWQPTIPCCFSFLQPFTPTYEFASPMFPAYPSWLRFGRSFYNYYSHKVFHSLIWHFFGRPIRKAEIRAGISPKSNHRKASPRTICYAFSPSVLSRPLDWPDTAHIVGYFFLDPPPSWKPPAALEDFLTAGSPPVYVGFGSMSSRRPEETAELAIRALSLAGRRGILLKGWGGLRQQSDLPSDKFFLTDSVPHAWLFPKTAAVVHHGGAGTTAAGFRAGVPSIVVPHFADQYFWAQKARDLGVGPAPIPRRKLSAEKLADAIKEALSNRIVLQRAKELGYRIGNENGVKKVSENFLKFAAPNKQI